MCEARRGRAGGALATWAFLALLGVAAPGGAAATQEARPPEAAEGERIQARLDSLRPLLAEARQRAAAETEALLAARRAGRSEPTDTLRVGPLRVLVLEGKAEQARPYFEEAWAHYAPMLGGRVPDRLGVFLFSFQYGVGRQTLPADPQLLRVSAQAWRRPHEVGAVVRRAVGLALAQAIPGWSDFAGVSPVGQMPAMEGVYRRLVLGASPALARCREGDLRSCWIAMGVTGVADAEAEVRLWYDPDQRRELVEAAYARVRGPTGCIMLGEQAACDEILAARRNTLVPLNPSARAALASVALEIGGDGALARLSDAYAGGADVRERIASAAGVPADQVMAEWHRRVTGSRPERGREARQVRVASLLWILLLLAFSTRSTRWRLG